MIDIRLIVEDTDRVARSLAKRGGSYPLAEIVDLDKRRREVINDVESKKAERNKASADIALLKRNKQDATTLIEQMGSLGNQIKQLDNDKAQIEAQLNDLLARLPNMPDEDIVAGDKEHNAVLHSVGEQRKFDFAFANHVDICTRLGIIDYERGVKLGGNGYWLYRNKGAVLEWALLNYFVSTHLADGYEFILPPHMLNYRCGYGAGQFPKFSDEVYWIDAEEKTQFMLPTAETSLVNMFADEILDEKALPTKLFAYTPCYRKEAGSYRKEERGMIRGHQFNKVEMLAFTRPEQSQQVFEEMVAKAERLVAGLGLHYRLSKLAAADISASMARTYDIEVWLPSMGIYKEVSSVSNSNDYQARRNNTKYRDSATGKTRFVHTLNGSGLATSRILPAIVEQYQNADGSVTVPEVLRPYTGFDIIK